MRQLYYRTLWSIQGLTDGKLTFKLEQNNWVEQKHQGLWTYSWQHIVVYEIYSIALPDCTLIWTKKGWKISSKSVTLMDSTSIKWPNIFSWIIESPDSNVMSSEGHRIRHRLFLPSNQQLILIHEKAIANLCWNVFDRSSWLHFQMC